MAKIILLILTMIPCFSVWGSPGLLMIEFRPYAKYYINLDGTPYYSTESSLLIPDVEIGQHVLTVKEKSEYGQELVYNFEIKSLPSYIVLIQIEGEIQAVINGEAKIRQKYISDITISADSISYQDKENSSAEKIDTGCKSYSSAELQYIIGQYVNTSNKVSYLHKMFSEKCITQLQLENILDASLTNQEKFYALAELFPYLEDDANIKPLGRYFHETIYYRDFLKLVGIHGQ